MKCFLMIGILLLLIGTVTGTAMAVGNTIDVDLPGFIIGIYPVNYNTAISSKQTIDFGFTNYSTNELYSKAYGGHQSGYAASIGISNYFNEDYAGLYFQYDIGYANVKNSGNNNQGFINGSSCELDGNLGYKKILENGLTFDISAQLSFDFTKNHFHLGIGEAFITGYSW
jgi:hypothetical protein